MYSQLTRFDVDFRNVLPFYIARCDLLIHNLSTYPIWCDLQWFLINVLTIYLNGCDFWINNLTVYPVWWTFLNYIFDQYPPAPAFQSAVIAFQAIRLFFYVFRGPKYPHDLPHQIHFSESAFLLKHALFSSLFSRPKTSEKRLPRHPKNIKNRSRNSFKTISMQSRFPQ